MGVFSVTNVVEDAPVLWHAGHCAFEFKIS